MKHKGSKKARLLLHSTRRTKQRSGRRSRAPDHDFGEEDGEEEDVTYEAIIRALAASGTSRDKPSSKSRRGGSRPAGKLDKKDNVENVENVAYADYTAEEAEFYAESDAATQTKIAALEKRIVELNDANIPLRFKILLSDIDDKVKAVAMKKMQALYNLDERSSEHYKILAWVEALCSLPINKYCKLPVDSGSPRAEVSRFLADVRTKLDRAVYGHDQAKDQIVRLIAQWIINPDAKGMVLGIHGSCGVGKTTLVKDGICSVLNMPFAFLPLGGAGDSAYLEGHSYTYEGSTWGKLVDVLMKCGVCNPVLYFDELDKVSTSHKGDEIINKLIHLTDPAQNACYTDRYFYDVELDLSRCLVIFSYNQEELVNPILRDRMVRIRTDGYNLRDKKAIARDYLVPRMLAEFSMAPGDVVFSDDVIAYIVEYVEPEEGVRNLKRALHDVVSSLNLNRLVSACGAAAEGAGQGPVCVTRQHVADFVTKVQTKGSVFSAAMYS